MSETLESLQQNYDSYTKLITLYTKIKTKKKNSGLDISTDVNYKSYIKLIQLYNKINTKLLIKINELKAQSPAVVPPAVVPSPAKAPSPAPAPSSSATQSVAKTEDEKKLEKIKALLKANEQIINECGFKIES